MKNFFVVFILHILFFCWYIPTLNCATVILKNGQKYQGDIIEEDEDIIKLQTVFGLSVINKDEVVSIDKDDDEFGASDSNDKLYKSGKSGIGLSGDRYSYDRDQIIGIEDQNQAHRKLSSDDDIVVPEIKPDNKQSLTQIEYYQNQVIYLKKQNKILNSEITKLDNEIKTITENYEKREKAFVSKIKGLEEEVKKKSQRFYISKFPELTTIESGMPIDINNGYLKKIMLSPLETMDGYFVSVKYTLYTEYVTVKPNFEVYFFNENGLNIGKDVVEYKYNKLERGQQELIEKGVPMSIPGSAPVYYYIKMIKAKTEEELGE